MISSSLDVRFSVIGEKRKKGDFWTPTLTLVLVLVLNLP